MPVVDFVMAILCASVGTAMLRMAFRLARRQTLEDRRRYPTSRHVVRGAAPGRSGRTGWMLYNTQKNRIKAR